MIKKNEFKDYLNLIKLKGLVENKEILFNTTKNSITAYARSLDKSFGLRAVYSGSEFEERDEVALLYFSEFIEFVNNLEGDFNMTFKENKIILESESKKTKTKIATTMQHKEIISNRLESEKFDKIILSLDESSNKILNFKIDKDTLKEITKKYNTVFSAKDEELLTINLENRNFCLKLNNKNKQSKLQCNIELETLSIPKDQKIEFNIDKKFIDLISCIDNDINVCINTPENKVMCITYNGENSNFKYLLALQPVI